MEHDSTTRSAGAGRSTLFVLCLFALAISLLPIARAQDVTLPSTRPPDLDLPPANSSPEPTIAPPQIIPPDILPMPDATAAPVAIPPGSSLRDLDEALKPKPLSPASEDYRMHLQWRKLQNQVQNEPRVKAALELTEHAHTDLEKRKLLAQYLDLSFDRMVAIGPPEMKNYLNDRRRDLKSALPQPRVRPTPIPKPTPTPKATAKGKITPAGSLGSPPPEPALPSSSATPTPASPKVRP